jgi:hypothetical protein
MATATAKISSMSASMRPSKFRRSAPPDGRAWFFQDTTVPPAR